MTVKELGTDYKLRVIDAMMAIEERSSIKGNQFATIYGLKGSEWSTMRGKQDKKIEKLLGYHRWMELGRLFGVSIDNRAWNRADTVVYKYIKKWVLFCKEYSKGRILVDECAIGKTFTAMQLSQELDNCFYVDASQCKSKTSFAKTLAQAIGANPRGRYEDTKGRIKQTLKSYVKPVVIIDEAGDLSKDAFLDIKEYCNATVGLCGWYLMGAEGLQALLQDKIKGMKPGYREIFSRLGDKYDYVVPKEKDRRLLFYRELILSVLHENAPQGIDIRAIANRCLSNDVEDGESTGLRRAEALLILAQEEINRNQEKSCR